MPDANRLHRGMKLAGRVAVYTHRDTRQLLGQLAGARIHRGDEIPHSRVRQGGDRERSARCWIGECRWPSRCRGARYVSHGQQTLTLAMTEYRLDATAS